MTEYQNRSKSMSNHKVMQKTRGHSADRFYIWSFYLLLNMLKTLFGMFPFIASVFHKQDEVNKIYFNFEEMYFLNLVEA